MLADISRGSGLPAGLWAKGFVEEMVKGSRKLKAGPQNMLGMAQAVLVSGQRQRKETPEKGRGEMSLLQTPPSSGTRSRDSRRLRAATSAAQSRVSQPVADLRDISGALVTVTLSMGQGRCLGWAWVPWC